MRKALDKIRSNWKVLVILGVLVGICIFLKSVFNNYGTNIGLMWVAVIIAAIAAIAALESLGATRKSLKTTRESLELTRATTRPFLTLKEADITVPETLVRFVVKNTGTLPAENGKFKVNIISLQEPDAPEIILEGEIPLLFPNDEMSLFLPTDTTIIHVPMPTSDFVSLVNSGKEIHFRLEMKYRSFEKEYVYGKVLKLLPRQKGQKALANLVSVEGSSYYK